MRCSERISRLNRFIIIEKLNEEYKSGFVRQIASTFANYKL
jgi:hypothetical protein